MICLKTLLSNLCLILAGSLFRMLLLGGLHMSQLDSISLQESQKEDSYFSPPKSSLPFKVKVNFYLLFPTLQTEIYFSFHVDWLYFTLILCLAYWPFYRHVMATSHFG